MNILSVSKIQSGMALLSPLSTTLCFQCTGQLAGTTGQYQGFRLLGDIRGLEYWEMSRV